MTPLIYELVSKEALSTWHRVNRPCCLLLMSLKVLGTNVNIKYVDTRCDMEEDFTVCSNLFVTSLTVSGFVEIAGPSGKEYIFVIDVTWSDNRSLTVKRTYKDFLNFRSKLLNAVKRVKCDVNIPELQGKHNTAWQLINIKRVVILPNT